MKDKRLKEAYSQICKVYDEFKDIENEKIKPFLEECHRRSENGLLLLDWKEKYGIDITNNYNIFSSQIKIDTVRCILYFADGYESKENGRGFYIMNSEKQPIDTWILKLGFSTGAYILGEDYPVDLFKRFYEELKSYKPDYEDKSNRHLYWKIENATLIYNEYKNIYDKYIDIYQKEHRKKEIELLKKKLSKLKKEN